MLIPNLTTVSDWTDGDHQGARKLKTEIGVSRQALKDTVQVFFFPVLRHRLEPEGEMGHGIVTANEMMLQFKGHVRNIISLQDKS